MKIHLIILLLLSITASGGTNEWSTWTPREEISPKFSTKQKAGRQRGTALVIETKNYSEYGAWERTYTNLHSEKPYTFSTWYKAENIPDERRSIIARLEWLDQHGKSIRPPEYALDTRQDSPWKKVSLQTDAPKNASSLKVQLSLGFVNKGKVLWDEPILTSASIENPRIVRAATVFHRPRGTKTAAESVEQFCKIVQKSSTDKPDIICLPEGITVIGNGKSYAEVSESVPGPTTERLGQLSKALGSYIVAGIYERSGKIVYNTAVLIGRDGALVGKYRKTHLPREEWEAGITPGDEYPVFDTDFGKIGLTICWDLQFPEPARAMALKGAEIILLPIWGGSEILAQARAIENHVFLVSSSYDMRSFIVNPAGKILAEATKEKPFVVAELYLDRKIYQPWLGDMKNRTWKERRADIPVTR